MKKSLTLLLCALMCSIQLMAQQLSVSGTVVDSSDEPIPGALVSLQSNPKEATTTDLDGNFTLSVPAGGTITVSFIGFEKAIRKINPGETNVRIVMKEDVVSLNEVVAIGYGTQKKKLITGSTVQVKGDQIARTSNVSAFTALQSMTPGVQIKSNSGKPGDGFAVTIRGMGTTGDSSPLYIIDGLVGGANVSFHHHDGTITKGTFSFNSSVSTERAALEPCFRNGEPTGQGWVGSLTISGTTIPCGELQWGMGPAREEFEIAVLSADEMILIQWMGSPILCDPDWATGSTHWCFVRDGVQ